MKCSGHVDYASGVIAKTGDKYLDANLSLHKWCLIDDFNCVTPGIQHITERESKNTFKLFSEGP